MTRLIRKKVALILVLLLSIENFAAVVGDNDGAAFITKAEFDSLKNNFQAQIDQYNTSIDSKIDGAIAGYLAGITTTKQNPLDNDFETIKINDTQYVKDLLWSKSADFRVNEPIESAGDTQLIGQFVRWYATAAHLDVATQMTFEYYNGYEENRLEVDNDNGIIGWGPYSASVDGVVFFFNDIGSDAWPGTAGGFFPYPADTIAKVMRKPTNLTWNCFTHYLNRRAKWESTASLKSMVPEGSWVKYNEGRPSDAAVFDIGLFRISPLSDAYDAVLPPQPKVSDPDYSYNNSNYGNFCGSDGQQSVTAIASAGANIATLSYAKMEGGGATTTYKTTTTTLIHKNLRARWFNVQKSNDMHLAVVTSTLGVKSPIKCGLPITRKVEFFENDKIICKITNVPENGYLVLYVAKDPMENWNGAKPSYLSDKWKLEKNVQKTIEIEVTQKIKGHVFAVWLPDIDCKIPDINMVIER